MLAAIYKGFDNPLVVEDIQNPKIEDDEVLIELKAAGICGSDMHYVKGDTSPGKVPIILGHEGSGIVREVGKDVHNLSVGDHVIIHYVISCGNCKNCISGHDNRCRSRLSIGHDVDGTFAEFIRVPGRNAIKISDTVPFDQAAITSCAVSTAYHAIKISDMKVGDTVVVFGTGGVGLHAVMWAKFFGASVVIAVDVAESNLKMARDVGADLIINSLKNDA